MGECARLKSFKVTMMEQDLFCYFAMQSTAERAAEEERSGWVLAISHAIMLITSSLLPLVPITCDPIPNMPRTYRRLLAGYLVHKDDEKSLSVIYCELNAHEGESARFAIYEDHSCKMLLLDILINELTV